MLKLGLLVSSWCFVLTSTVGVAQNLCPPGTNNSKLICLNQNIQLDSVSGNSQLQSVAPFTGNFAGSFAPLNASIGRQSALLPLASPSSGITFSWDSVAKTYVASTDSYGPILGERAETIGKGRVFIGFSYQYFKFDAIDGVNLKGMRVVLTQPDSINPADPTRTCSINGDNFDTCGYVRDVIRSDDRIDLKVHQFTTYLAYGLTNRLDVSAAIPIENVRMAIFSTATIVNNSQSFFHVFVPRTDCPYPCFQASFSSARSASGIGDITLRVKGTAWKGERAGFALGLDVRVPTGDQLNFLGSGAAGVRPFVNWSYRSRVSPHAIVGYEVNGSSVVAGDITAGRKERLPSQLTYTAGADAWLTKRISAAFDLVGQEVFEAQRSSVGAFTEPAPCTDFNCNAFAPPNVDQSLVSQAGSYNSTSASIGAKIRPFSRLLLTGNVLIRLTDNTGLRAKYVPLVGLSYTF
jgi:hypothetical protein